MIRQLISQIITIIIISVLFNGTLMELIRLIFYDKTTNQSNHNNHNNQCPIQWYTDWTDKTDLLRKEN